MKGKLIFFLGITCLISVLHCVPLDDDNQLSMSDESRELTEDEIFAKIAALHNKLEEEFKSFG